MFDPINYFLPYQQAWINESAPLAIGEKSRRIGFTHAHAFRAVERRVRQLGDYWHSSADQSASVEFIEECETWAKIFNVAAKIVEAEEIVDEMKIATLQMRFGNGQKIVAGSSNPKFFRSKGGEAGLDEYAFHAQARELYKAAHATALFWQYPLRIWSTHNGEGSFFNSIIKSARSGKLKAAMHRVTVLDAVEQGLVEKIRKLKTRDDKARQEWLDELRGTCPDDDVWNEEYLCTPSSDQSSLLSYELIRGCEDPTLKLVDVDQLDRSGSKRYYAGYDIGRKRDLSVIWVLEKVGDVYHTRVLKRMENTTFADQEGVNNLLMQNRSIRRQCIDSTGLGMMLAERAGQRFGSYRCEAVSFTAPVKSELAMPLRRLFEDKRVRIPADDQTRESLHKIRKIVTASNNVRLDADRDESGHADEFWALALAAHAADDVKLPLPPSTNKRPAGL